MNSPPITALQFVRLFYYIFKNAAEHLNISEFYNAISLSDLEMRLEILACDASCASIRASELALVLICTQMDAQVSNQSSVNQQIHGLVDYAIEMQRLCRVSLRIFRIFYENIKFFLNFPSDSRQQFLPQSQHCGKNPISIQRATQDALQTTFGVETFIKNSTCLTTN